MKRVSLEEYKNLTRSPVKSKYRNKAFWINGEYWHSQKEYSRYLELKLLERQGFVKSLRRQVKITLKAKTKASGKICFVVDFTYNWDDFEIIEDVKSDITRKLSTYRIKKKLLLDILKPNQKFIET